MTEHCAKVSIIGAGMAGYPGVTANNCYSFSGKKYSNFAIGEIVIRQFEVLVKETDLVEAVNAFT